MDARDNKPPDICLYEFCVAELYNNERPHQGLDYKTPAEVYWGKAERLQEAA